MIPELMGAYSIDMLAIGLLSSSFFYTYIALQVPAGMMLDLWGPRKVLKFSFLLASIGVIWFTCSHSFWEGQASRMLMGMGTAPAIISSFCLASRWFKPHLFVLLCGLTESLALVGGAFGSGGLSKLVIAYGWREAMLVVSAFGVMMTLLCFYLIHDHPDTNYQQGVKKTFSMVIDHIRENFSKVISEKQIWLNGLYAGLMFGMIPAFAALWSVPYFIKRFDLSVDIAAMMAATFFIGAAVGTFSLGWLAVSIHRKRLFMLMGAALACFLMLLAIYYPFIQVTGMFTLLFFCGFCCSSFVLSFSQISHYVDPKSKGIAMGLANMLCLTFGAPFYQPLIGMLLKWSANEEYTLADYQLAFTVLPASLLIAFILTFFIRDTKPHGKQTIA